MSTGTNAPRGRRSRRPLGPPAASAGFTVFLLLASAAPALAQAPGHGGHEIGSGDEGSETAAVILRVVLLLLSGLVAGIALLRPFARVDNQPTRLVVQVCAGLSAAALLLSAATAGVGLGYAVVQAAFTLFIPLLWRRPLPTAVFGALLTLLLAAEAADAHEDTPAVIGMTHSAAATIWLSAVALFLTADRDARRRTLRLLVPISVVGALALTVTGLLAAGESNLAFDDASAGSGFGRIVAVKSLVLVAVVALGVVLFVRRRGQSVTPGAGRLPFRVGALSLAAALGLGATLAALDPPALAAPAGRLALQPVSVDGDGVGVAVVAHRPGPNLVHVAGEGYSVGTDPDRMVPAAPRPGAAGGWAVLDLPSGESEIYVERGGDREAFLVDAQGAASPAGLLGPDGPECATAWLGADASEPRRDEPVSCPADALSAADAESLRSVVRHFQARRAGAVQIVADASPRSVAAAEVVRQEAAVTGLRIVDERAGDTATLVVAGWERANEQLVADATHGLVGYGTYLAPWLATGPLLTYSTGAVSVLRFDPGSTDAKRYVSALTGERMAAQVSPAGFLAWQGRTFDPATAPSLLYASAVISILPSGLGHTHGSQTGWLPGGGLTAVSQPLP